ncbi:MAG: hypothetical protein ACLFRV_10085 [Acidimicrobiales bacterium]
MLFLRRTPHRWARLAAVLSALALFLAACGDDDGGGGAMSDDEFCEMMADLEEDAADLDDLEALAMFTDVADQAPDPEVREAMQLFAEKIDELEGLDEDDPEAMGEAFAVMMDPEVTEATETIDTYMSDVCGIDTGTDVGGDDGGFFDEDDETSTEDDAGGVDGPESDGSAMDDLSAGDVREALGDDLDELVPENTGSGVGIFPSGDAVVVDLTVYLPEDGGDVDALGLCNLLADTVESMTDDPGIRLEVLVDDDDVAERQPGGSCEEV